MSVITCTSEVLRATIDILRRGGSLREERVALLLASSSQRTPTPIVEVYEPDQETAIDYFRLPPAAMQALMQHLRQTRRRIAAQIHTHPGRAFHSEADAEWAIVRHVGALSLVLPHFAACTTPENFLEEVMTYEYGPTGVWELCPNHGLDARVQVVR